MQGGQPGLGSLILTVKDNAQNWGSWKMWQLNCTLNDGKSFEFKKVEELEGKVFEHVGDRSYE